VFKPACLGKLAGCGAEKNPRFHVTCLWCRTRRRFIGKFTEPPYWVFYTYTSWWAVNYVRKHVVGDRVIMRSDGGWFKIEYPYRLRIDPRGHFLMPRCAVIIWIDRLMLKFGVGYKKTVRNQKGEVVRFGKGRGMRKPWAEICEFLANYPVW
jgi:hypothetical protein